MGHEEAYGAAARRLGQLIAEKKYALVFGGGSIGLMGQAARAARDGGAPVIGILPEFLRTLEPPLKSAEELIVTPDLYQRKDRMMAMASASFSPAVSARSMNSSKFLPPRSSRCMRSRLCL